MSIIQLSIIFFALFAITRTVRQFQRASLTTRWLFFWILFWVVAAIVAVLPQTADFLAQVAGVGRGADVVIYLSLVLLFYFVFRLYVKIEQVEGEITRLVRTHTLDEFEKKE